MQDGKLFLTERRRQVGGCRVCWAARRAGGQKPIYHCYADGHEADRVLVTFALSPKTGRWNVFFGY